MNSRWIDIDTDNGNNFRGYLSLPPTGTGPGIVLIQEIWGVNDHIQAVADQYAMDGYVVLAPDVFWRLQPGVNLGYDEAGSSQAFNYMKHLDFPQAVQDLTVAVNKLRSLPETRGGVASVGYCMGGLLSYLCAANAGVDAAVCYYGGGIHNHLDQAGKISCPILMHFAEKDHFIPASAVEAVKAAFANAKNAVIETYPDVDHGFNCWQRPSYNQKAAAVAHGMSLSFLGKVL
ncbi:dienelactone hydrolase family protein [Noviherbaspirillum pedocola]|uniref:Dienelactone hydrolase family protein n=1 Tax=Noviherbaspirillum pedocola TaxID=2801341 RepID=A0A934SQ91_9BURK|nr:dienelactone hydrolase family protein [Noviherbaspirillum pedocola]MBK4734610.1 dienelactone hydrolase family protein [Noviherbaspirillum pedocola]